MRLLVVPLLLAALLPPLAHCIHWTGVPAIDCAVTISACLWYVPWQDWDTEDYKFKCPPGCLGTINHTHPDSGPRVWGSYPYHVNSSACLAAVHCGVLDDTEGGLIYLSRFRRYEWTNDSRETVFPFNTSLGSHSNGVDSLAVPASWHRVPAGPHEQSATVTVASGLFLRERRVAPFAARAGHLHTHRLQFSNNSALTRGTISVVLVVGGHNATYYMNVSHAPATRT